MASTSAPITAAQQQRILFWRKRRFTIKGIAEQMEAEGWRSPTGRRWQGGTVAAVLRHHKKLHPEPKRFVDLHDRFISWDVGSGCHVEGYL